MKSSRFTRFAAVPLFAGASLLPAFAADIVLPGYPIVGSSGNHPAGEAPEKVIDNSAATKYLNFDKTNTGFTVTLPAPRPVASLNFISANDDQRRDPAGFELYGSNDGENFTLITAGALNFPENRFSSLEVLTGSTAAYSNYRVVFPTVKDEEGANSMQIAEVQFLQYQNILHGATITGSQAGNPNEGPDTLNDGLLGSKMGVPGGGTQVLTIIPTTAYDGFVAKSFALWSANDNATYNGRHPSSLLIEGSNDGVNFTTLYENAALEPLDVNYTLQEFAFEDNETPYQQYRVTLGQATSGFMQVSEIQLFGKPVPEPGTAALGGLAAFALAVRRKRR